MKDSPYMHIFPQSQWHDEAVIVANLQGLIALRKAIDDAINTGSGFSMSFAGDGEGYNTLVGRVEDSLFDGLAYPYTDEIAQERRDDPVWPHMIPSVQEAQTLALEELERKYPKNGTV